MFSKKYFFINHLYRSRTCPILKSKLARTFTGSWFEFWNPWIWAKVAFFRRGLHNYEGRYWETVLRGSDLFVCTECNRRGIWSIWPATYPGNTFNFKPQKGWSRIFHLDSILERKPSKKVDLGKWAKLRGCLVFLDFLPEIVKILTVGYSYPKEWLLPVILSYLAPPNSLSVAFCAH